MTNSPRPGKSAAGASRGLNTPAAPIPASAVPQVDPTLVQVAQTAQARNSDAWVHVIVYGAAPRSALMAVGFTAGCGENMAQHNSPSPKRDINAVLRDHDKKLLAIPGVVGVYVAVLDSGLLDSWRQYFPQERIAVQLDVNLPGVPKAKAGFGRVETVTVMPTASAGGTAANMMSRISIKMEDGTTQYVDTSVSGLAPGDRVEITNEGYLKR